MCDCAICTRSKAFQKHIELVPAESKKFFEAIYDVLLETESSLEYRNALVDGSWPDADTVIATIRSRKPK